MSMRFQRHCKKIKFFVKDLLIFPWICSLLLKKSLTENFIFRTVKHNENYINILEKSCSNELGKIGATLEPFIQRGVIIRVIESYQSYPNALKIKMTGSDLNNCGFQKCFRT